MTAVRPFLPQICLSQWTIQNTIAAQAPGLTLLPEAYERIKFNYTHPHY